MRSGFSSRPFSSRPPAGCVVGPCYLVSKYRLKLEHCDHRLFEAFGATRRGTSAARFLYQVFGSQHRELAGALYYDVRARVIGYAVTSIGTLTSTLIEPRAFFVPAFLANAASMTMFHFHPSGDVGPSHEDLQVTRRMKQCGDLMGVAVKEHLILGHHGQFARVESP